MQKYNKNFLRKCYYMENPNCLIYVNIETRAHLSQKC